MQEETTQKTIALAIKTSKLTASVLQKAMKMYLEHQNEYYGAAEPPVRCGESHLSGLTEPLRSL